MQGMPCFATKIRSIMKKTSIFRVKLQTKDFLGIIIDAEKHQDMVDEEDKADMQTSPASKLTSMQSLTIKCLSESSQK
jgi:hypothetical protein